LDRSASIYSGEKKLLAAFTLATKKLSIFFLGGDTFSRFSMVLISQTAIRAGQEVTIRYNSVTDVSMEIFLR
jgi:hypothetical protein